MRAPATATRPTTGSLSSSCCRILPHCHPHSTDRINLVFERLPVVAFVDRRPDRLDLVDMHRAGLRIPPIGMRLLAFASFERLGQCAEGVGRIKLDAGIAAAAPVEEDPVDRLCTRA